MQLPKPPPSNHDLEKSLVSSILQNKDVFADVVEVVPTEEMFHDPGAREVYRAILELNRKGEPFDTAIVGQHLYKTGRVNEVGGMGNYAEITKFSPTTVNAKTYAIQVKDLWMARQMIYIGNDMARDASELAGGEPAEIRARYEKELFSLAEVGVESKALTSNQVMASVMDGIDRYSDSKGNGPKTGFIDIDCVFMGFSDSTVTVLAGRPGGGKSKFAGNVIVNLANEGVRSMFYSLEMTNEEIGTRMACSVANVDNYRLIHGMLTDEEKSRLNDACAELGRMPVFWQDRPGLKPMELLASLRRMKRRHGIQFAVIDHMLLMGTDRKYNSRNDEVGEISRTIKLAAKELKIPILALCQMNRGVEHRTDECPRLSDLRDSGNIEQDADNVMFLHREKPKDSTPITTVDVHIAKQRNGPLGKATLYDRANCFRFENFQRGFSQ